MTILLTVSITGMFVIYRKNEEKKIFYTLLLLVLVLLDNSIVYLSEYSLNFGSLYETSDLVYLMIYLNFIAIVVTGRFLLKEILMDSIERYEWFVLVIVSVLVGALNLFIDFRVAELLVYCSFYVGIAYILCRSLWCIYKTDTHTKHRFNKTRVLLIMLVFTCIVGVFETWDYYLSYDSVVKDILEDLDYRNLAFDGIKIIMLFVSLDYTLKHIGLEGATTLDLNGKIDEFCEKYALTPRQREIVELMVEGDSNKEISGKLFITEGTVKTHVYNIFQKTEMTSRNQMINKIVYK